MPRHAEALERHYFPGSIVDLDALVDACDTVLLIDSSGDVSDRLLRAGFEHHEIEHFRPAGDVLHERLVRAGLQKRDEDVLLSKWSRPRIHPESQPGPAGQR